MMFKTHLAAGFLVGIVMLPYLKPSNPILYITLVMLGSALPDIDHPESKVGRKFPMISLLFEHRGFFHSLFVLPVIAILFFWASGRQIVMLSILVGYLSHLITDALTKEGIMPLHPITKFRLRGFLRTGHSLEYAIFLILLFVNGYILYNL